MSGLRTAPWWPFLALAGFAALVCWFYGQPPKLGDDIDYWRLAMDLHLGEEGAWRADSFHHLRWPVWGMCWLLMWPFGVSGAAYFLQPVVYLILGTWLVYWLAGKAGLGLWGRLAAGAFLAMHPLMDSALIRPMPDLSEGFWVALSFALWLAMVDERRRIAKIALCVGVGLALAIAQANRITGVFAVPVLLVCTLALHPRQFGWLLLCGAFAAGFVLAEALVYLALTGDLFHSIHANLTARGNRGTEPIPVWMFPLRFLSTLWRLPHDILMSSLAVAGALYFWRSGGKAAKALVLYGIVYYLAFSCAPQSFFPLRPMVRDGDRFLASLAFPLSVLAVGGPLLVWAFLPQWLRDWKPIAIVSAKPWLGILLILALLAGLNDRTRGVQDYLDEVAKIVNAQPEGSVIVSHAPLQAVARMAAPEAAQKLDWRIFHNVLEPSESLLRAVEEADGIWLLRKHAWVPNRKRSERGQQDILPALAPYLIPPFDGWHSHRSVLRDRMPDFVFLTRTQPGAQLTLTSAQALFPTTLPTIPWRGEFPKGSQRRFLSEKFPIPDRLQGIEIFVALRGASNEAEPARVRLQFVDSRGRELPTIEFHPYMFPRESPDFFAFQIPEDAETGLLSVEIRRRTEWIEVEGLDFFVVTEEGSSDWEPSPGN